MPYEAKVITGTRREHEDYEMGDTYGGRSPQQVAEDLNKLYDKAAERGGKLAGVIRIASGFGLKDEDYIITMEYPEQ